MKEERFEGLAHAFGGDMARWPQGEWTAAAEFASRQPELASRILAEAGRLDGLLDAWSPPPVSSRLREALIAAAPSRRVWPRLGVLWRLGAGASLAAACAAGLAVGVLLSDAVAPTAAPNDEVLSAALSGYDDLAGLVNGEGV